MLYFVVQILKKKNTFFVMKAPIRSTKCVLKSDIINLLSHSDLFFRQRKTIGDFLIRYVNRV